MDQVATYNLVMIIDDNQIDRLVAKTVIRECNLAQEILSIATADSGLQYLRENINSIEKLPEIIFLDINMPEMDGFGFLNVFEKMHHGIKEHCSIWMLTSSEDPDDFERSMKYAYVKEFIKKPLRKEALMKILNRS